MQVDKYIQLGKTDIMIAPIGLGTMQWVNIHKPAGYSILEENNYREIFHINLDMGINFYDTAEIYGNGNSESYLGKYYKEIEKKIVIAIKFMPFPWRLSKGQFRSALKRSMTRLGIGQVDLYQIHWPFPPVPIKAWMHAMSDAVADGIVRAVGVSNYSLSQTEIACEALSKHDIPLASNQIKYNLLNRRPDKSGLINLCNQLGITVIAY